MKNTPVVSVVRSACFSVTDSCQQSCQSHTPYKGVVCGLTMLSAPLPLVRNRTDN